jgi:pyruvate/2-oxoglutarate dehydrogenase complex dihydrolipoamide dehydrogenase (E3) component
MATVHQRIEQVAATEDADTLAREGIEVLAGRARLTGGRGIDVDGRRIQARHIILATGARAAVPPIPGLREQPHLTNETIFDLDSQPDRLAILGGGAIGVELAQAFCGLGSGVTVVEAEPRLLPARNPRPRPSSVSASALAASTCAPVPASSRWNEARRATCACASATARSWQPIGCWSPPAAFP